MIEIAPPYCDWIQVKCKDQRKGSLWLCNACGHQGRAKEVPKCPCKPIKIGDN